MQAAGGAIGCEAGLTPSHSSKPLSVYSQPAPRLACLDDVVAVLVAHAAQRVLRQLGGDGASVSVGQHLRVGGRLGGQQAAGMGRGEAHEEGRHSQLLRCTPTPAPGCQPASPLSPALRSPIQRTSSAFCTTRQPYICRLSGSARPRTASPTAARTCERYRVLRVGWGWEGRKGGEAGARSGQAGRSTTARAQGEQSPRAGAVAGAGGGCLAGLQAGAGRPAGAGGRAPRPHLGPAPLQESLHHCRKLE